MLLIEGINGSFKCISVDILGLVILDEVNVGFDVIYVENELIWFLLNKRLV